MKIEISVADNGKPLASSYSKFYTSHGDPIVDVIVREAIQNSLDAGLNTHKHAETTDFVKVDFSVGEFNSREFSCHLDGVTDKLNAAYPHRIYSYFAIRDYYTSGLTGPLSFQECEDLENPGNLIKLVFNIAQPNKDDGAGGSCGIGKTIFYTLGAGIVVYYSRVYEDGKGFESRLVVSMIDTKNTKIIPDFEGERSIGIAWWGNQYKGKKNKIIPITDENQINQFLRIFRISSYEGKETGTTLIIPYIDENELVKRNAKYPDQNQSLMKCIKEATQRWYFPRLINRVYSKHFGDIDIPGSRKYLKVYTNGELFTRDSWYPLTHVYQELYNYALTGINQAKDNEVLDNLEIEFKDIVKINVNGKMENPLAGNLACCYVSQESLKRISDNNPTPGKFLYVLKSDDSKESEPIIGFCRRAGMIGSYNGGEWLKGVPPLAEDKSHQHMICIFVVNSKNRLKNSQILLDSYVRESELNDHKDWVNDRCGIIEKIKRNVASKLTKELKDTKSLEEDNLHRDARLVKMITEALLPPLGYGRKAIKPRRNSKKSSNVQSNSTINMLGKPKYERDFVTISYGFTKQKGVSRLSLNMHVILEKGSSTISEWIQSGLPIPISIEKISICFDLKSKRKFKDRDSDFFQLHSNRGQIINDIEYKKNIILQGERKYVFGFDITFNAIDDKVVGVVELEVKLIDRSVKTILKCDKS